MCAVLAGLGALPADVATAASIVSVVLGEKAKRRKHGMSVDAVVGIHQLFGCTVVLKDYLFRGQGWK